MTAHTPQLDSEELEDLANELANYWWAEQKYTANGRWKECKQEATERLTALIQADRTAFADRVLGVVPEKKHHIESDRNIAYREGFNDCHDQVTTAITNLVAEERGEKK